MSLPLLLLQFTDDSDPFLSWHDLWPLILAFSILSLWFSFWRLQLVMDTVKIITFYICVFVFLPVRAHPHGSPSPPMGTPSSGRRGRQLPKLPAKSSSIEQGTLDSRMWVWFQKRVDAIKWWVMGHVSHRKFPGRELRLRQGCYIFKHTSQLGTVCKDLNESHNHQKFILVTRTLPSCFSFVLFC